MLTYGYNLETDCFVQFEEGLESGLVEGALTVAEKLGVSDEKVILFLSDCYCNKYTIKQMVMDYRSRGILQEYAFDRETVLKKIDELTKEIYDTKREYSRTDSFNIVYSAILESDTSSLREAWKANGYSHGFPKGVFVMANQLGTTKAQITSLLMKICSFTESQALDAIDRYNSEERIANEMAKLAIANQSDISLAITAVVQLCEYTDMQARKLLGVNDY